MLLRSELRCPWSYGAWDQGALVSSPSMWDSATWAITWAITWAFAWACIGTVSIVSPIPTLSLFHLHSASGVYCWSLLLCVSSTNNLWIDVSACAPGGTPSGCALWHGHRAGGRLPVVHTCPLSCGNAFCCCVSNLLSILEVCIGRF